MAKTNRYTYYKVIQENWGNSWDDVDFHETNSKYVPKDRKSFKENLKAYRANSNAPIRVVNRKEPVEGSPCNE
jgi:hypothetical protein